MGRMQDAAERLLAATPLDVDDDTPDDAAADAPKGKKAKEPHNPLCLFRIGQYEVWKGRKCYRVHLVGDCYSQGGDFETPEEALARAQELNAKAMAENERYLALRRLPVMVRSGAE
jgi:hypothetical protein